MSGVLIVLFCIFHIYCLVSVWNGSFSEACPNYLRRQRQRQHDKHGNGCYHPATLT